MKPKINFVILRWVAFLSVGVFFLFFNLTLAASDPPAVCVNNPSIQVCKDCVTCFKNGEGGLRQCASNALSCELQANQNNTSGNFTLAISSASIFLGEKLYFTAVGLPANQSGVIRALKQGSTGTGEQSINFSTDSSGNIEGRLAFNADPGDEGSWSAAIEISGKKSNVVYWKVAAAPTNPFASFQECRSSRSLQGGSLENCCKWFPADAACSTSGGGVGGGGSTGGSGTGDTTGRPIISPPDITGGGSSDVPKGEIPSYLDQVNVPPAPHDCPSGLAWNEKAGLCMLPSPFQGETVAGSSSLAELIKKIIDYLLFFGGMVAVVFIVVGGFWFVTSAGNEEQAEKGRKALINAIIGLVVVIMSFAIVTIISNLITKGPDQGNSPPATQN